MSCSLPEAFLLSLGGCEHMALTGCHVLKVRSDFLSLYWCNFSDKAYFNYLNGIGIHKCFLEKILRSCGLTLQSLIFLLFSLMTAWQRHKYYQIFVGWTSGRSINRLVLLHFSSLLCACMWPYITAVILEVKILRSSLLFQHLKP